MKKIISFLLIALMILTLSACKKTGIPEENEAASVNKSETEDKAPAEDNKTETEDKAPAEDNQAAPKTELDSLPIMSYAMVDGHFPTSLKDLNEWSQFIAVVTPTDTFADAKSERETFLRSCRVDKVIKGELTEGSQITVGEFAHYVNNGTAISLMGGAPLMAKGYKYLVFINNYNEQINAYLPLHSGVFCTNTYINEKYEINQHMYAAALSGYPQLFEGFDFRIMTETDKEFTTNRMYMGGYHNLKVNFEGKSYTNFQDHYFPQEHYFKSGIKYTYSGKEADGYRVYLSKNDGFNSRIIYLLYESYLLPMLRDGDSFENADIMSVRIYEKSNNDFCYQLKDAQAKALVKKLKAGNFPPENTNDMFDDDAVLLEFRDADGVYYRSVLFIEKGKLFGKTIGKELTDEILSFMTEDNKVKSEHISDTYK